MGEKEEYEDGGNNPHSASTVFVTNFPFSFNNAQMEEAFSEVGPIRRCFMVTKKGSTEHRGFVYVEFSSVITPRNGVLPFHTGTAERRQPFPFRNGRSARSGEP